MADKPSTNLIFPAFGVDLDYGHGSQRPGTTRHAINVRAYDPLTDRQRGGRRAGVAKAFSDQVPAGSTVLQHLSTIVDADEVYLWDSGDPPTSWGTTIDDPSDAGPPSSWGHKTIFTDWNGDPKTGDDEHTRNPGPRKTRRKGTGFQPNKNHLQHDPANPVTFLYQGQASVHVTGGPFGGNDLLFTGCMCVGQIYLALAGAPTRADQFPGWWRALHAFCTLHSIPENTLSFNTGSNLITGPVRQCLTSDITPGGCDVVTGGEQAGDQGP